MLAVTKLDCKVFIFNSNSAILSLCININVHIYKNNINFLSNSLLSLLQTVTEMPEIQQPFCSLTQSVVCHSSPSSFHSTTHTHTHDHPIIALLIESIVTGHKCYLCQLVLFPTHFCGEIIITHLQRSQFIL